MKILLILIADVLLVVWLAAPFPDRCQNRALRHCAAKKQVICLAGAA